MWTLPQDFRCSLQKLVFSVGPLFSVFSCLWLWSLSLLQFAPQQTACVISQVSLGPFSAHTINAGLCNCIIISNLLSLSPVSGQWFKYSVWELKRKILKAMPYKEISDGSSEFLETKVMLTLLGKKNLVSAGLGTPLQIPALRLGKRLAMQLKLILKSEEQGV